MVSLVAPTMNQVAWGGGQKLGLGMESREHLHKLLGWPVWRVLSHCLAGAEGQGKGAHVFGGLAEDVTHATTIPQSVVHDGDDAHK